MFCTIITAAYAQDTIPPPYETQAERIIDKYTAKASAAVVSLAEALKVPAEHVYRVLVRQYIIEGAVGVFSWFMLTAVIVFGTNSLIKHGYDHDEESKEVIAIIATFALAILFIPWLVLTFDGDNLMTSVTSLINPEYRVIQDITSIFK